jgi:glycosyltransferase involved in cell wall biosynthesis
MLNPKISILLVVKDALPVLVGALDSLQRQTFRDFDVVVVDGASTDGTLGVLREAEKNLPLRIVSEPDRSLSDGFAKALLRADGDIVGMLCADERYYPNTLAQIVDWFDTTPKAAMCGGKVDLIDEQDRIIASDLTAPFNLAAHLACELVPTNLSSFFNRRLIDHDFRFDSDVPSCPDYEYWARLGFRFPPSAFIRHDVSLAQAYRTRASMSFRAENFRQFARDKLTHLNNLLAAGYGGVGREALRPRASAGIHMWCAEQLNSIEPGHPDILAHCAAAARYDKSYERIPRLISARFSARYEAETGLVKRIWLGPRTIIVNRYTPEPLNPDWPGTAIISREPLTLRTCDSPWGYSLKWSLSNVAASSPDASAGQYWVRGEIEILEGSVGFGLYLADGPVAEQIFKASGGRAMVLIPLLDAVPAPPIMIRSGGTASSIARVHRIELMRDPDLSSETVAPIELDH